MLPCMYGSATFAMVESSVCISIASIADAVIRPRFGTAVELDIGSGGVTMGQHCPGRLVVPGTVRLVFGLRHLAAALTLDGPSGTHAG